MKDEVTAYRLERLADEIERMIEKDGASEAAIREIGRRAVDSYRAMTLALPWWSFLTKRFRLWKADEWARALEEEARR
jgi:predicted transcriptional regulator